MHELKLSEDNQKASKARALGYLQGMLYLAPHDRARSATYAYNVCPFAERCSGPCLYESGKGALASTQDSRIRKTREFFDEHEAFLEELRHAIYLLKKHASDQGLIPVLRLNGTSDIDWENPKSGGGIMQEERDLLKLDYTKSPKRMLDWLEGRPGSGALRNMRSGGHGFFKEVHNYSLTFSLGGKKDGEIPKILAAGGNVAAVWADKAKVKEEIIGSKIDGFEIPGRGKIKFGASYEVISGYDHDLRFMDPHPRIVALYALPGTKRMDSRGFFMNPSASPDGCGCGCSARVNPIARVEPHVLSAMRRNPAGTYVVRLSGGSALYRSRSREEAAAWARAWLREHPSVDRLRVERR